MDDSKRLEMEKLENEDDEEATKSVMKFFEGLGISNNIPEISNSHDFLSQLLGTLLKVDSISQGLITCSFTVLPSVSNFYKGLHGGAVALIAERLAIACARTVVSEEKSLFLGELSISYLSASPINAKLVGVGSVVRSGRNLTVVSIEIRLKEAHKLVYTAQVIFFHLPSSKL